MNAQAFHTAVLRLGLLEAADLAAAGILLSKREQQMFDADAVTFFIADAGPTRRQQIFDLIERPRVVPIVEVIEDRHPTHLKVRVEATRKQEAVDLSADLSPYNHDRNSQPGWSAQVEAAELARVKRAAE